MKVLLLALLSAFHLDASSNLNVGLSGKVKKNAAPPFSWKNMVPGWYDNRWQTVSAGDVQGITIHGGYIYALGYDTRLSVLERAIFRQRLQSMTPYSNWVLFGYGNMSSIAIHDEPAGPVMYGVGHNNWLYKQAVATMSNSSVWEVASVIPVAAISIEGDIIYGTSIEAKGHLVLQDLRALQVNSAWQPAGTGDFKAFQVASGTILAIFQNDALYHKSFTNKTEDATWTLKDQSGLLSIAVVGDTMYGVSNDHKVKREALTIHDRWAPMANGAMQSVAIGPNEDTIYGLGVDGKVYMQSLMLMSPDTEWLLADGAASFVSITIQGNMIYGVAKDKRVYKQTVSTMHEHDHNTWRLASSCCVSQIAAADGIIYGIGEDLRIYRQADVLMTPESSWILSSASNITSIAIRGDTIYGVDEGGHTLEQRLSTMTPTSPWTNNWFDDSKYPSTEYLSIMAHNDIMYAIGKNTSRGVHSKLIPKGIVYPSNLVAHGNTRWQAVHWNLTDLHHIGPLGKRTTTPPPVTTHAVAIVRHENVVVDEGPSTGSTTTQEAVDAGKGEHFVDRFQDQPGAKIEHNLRTGEKETVESVKLDNSNEIDQADIENGCKQAIHVPGMTTVVAFICAAFANTF
jgi:hypothetical protein